MTGSPQTFPQLLLLHAEERPDAVAMREKEYGIWQSLSWSDLLSAVRATIACLQYGLH